jgi:hypothetical protein
VIFHKEITNFIKKNFSRRFLITPSFEVFSMERRASVDLSVPSQKVVLIHGEASSLEEEFLKYEHNKFGRRFGFLGLDFCLGLKSTDWIRIWVS